MEETTLAQELTSSKSSNFLKTGYGNVNIPNASVFLESKQTLSEYLKEQIIIHFADSELSFVEEKDELRPTNYLKNDRPLKVFVVEDSRKKQHVFAFDVASCLN